MRKRMKMIGVVTCCIAAIGMLTGCVSSNKSTETDGADTEIVEGAEIGDGEGDGFDESTYDPLEAFTYSYSDIDSLDGLFRLDASGETMVLLDEDAKGANYYKFDGEEKEGALRWTLSEPITVSPSKGEKLILVGTEGANRAKNDQEQIQVYQLERMGYGNGSMLPDMELGEIQELEGIDFTKLEDYQAVNQAFAGTGLICHEYFRSNSRYEAQYLLLSDTAEKEVTYAIYEGTTYTPVTIQMWNPYYSITDWNEGGTIIPVEKTKNGYFEVDISGLSSGIYLISSYSGSYIFEIQ